MRRLLIWTEGLISASGFGPGGPNLGGGGPNPLGHRSKIYFWSITFYNVEVFFSQSYIAIRHILSLFEILTARARENIAPLHQSAIGS